MSPCSEILSVASLTTSTPYPSICNEAFVGSLLAQGTHYPVKSVGPVFCLFCSRLQITIQAGHGARQVSSSRYVLNAGVRE